MKTVSWNVRGLGSPHVVRRVGATLREFSPALIFLIETKLHSSKMERVRRKFGYRNGIDVSSTGRSVGLSLGWKDNVKVSLRSFSTRHIDVLIEADSDGVSWHFTGFYGAPETNNSQASWDFLRSLNDSPHVPWCVLGDFNEILSLEEKQGGLLRSDWQMNNFRNALLDCNLDNLGYRGAWFTWEWGRHASNNIRERLDRGVANQAWWDLLPNFQVDHLPHSISDHCPILLNSTGLSSLPSRIWHFRFEAAWLLERSCEDEFRNLWAAANGPLLEKLAHVGRGLEAWFKRLCKEKKLSVKELQQKLADLNTVPVTEDSLGEILETKLALNFELDREEIYWEQRARANWLKNGDRNTNLFHRYASQRRRRNRVSRLEVQGGGVAEEEDKIQNVAKQYFENLFSSSGSSDPSTILEDIGPSITQGMNEALLKDFWGGWTWSVILSAILAHYR
ncbi:hypothetical protein HRI_003355800 [Hibiscus trionum]|uniref:Endonuclease/exonuclease/phosphatase domain-containing protein n=1 Tax=Hibiscus trionum TaxID=183268 RepID=A0A9W7IKY0_HIBTR|nr:hypothetical protein HRI_003355800 [Hibiscus trionum]